MQIEEMESFSSKHRGFSVSNVTDDSSTSKADIDFFTSTLEHSKSPIHVTATASGPSVLIEASNQLIKATDRISRSLRSISRNADKDELAKFPNQLSSSLFLSQIMVKSLGKTTQCIDKICNLQ